MVANRIKNRNVLLITVFIKYRITGKGLAKAGIRKTEIPTKPEPSKNHFRFFKITKNKKTKMVFCGEKCRNLLNNNSQPRFCQTHVIRRPFLVVYLLSQYFFNV